MPNNMVFAQIIDLIVAKINVLLQVGSCQTIILQFLLIEHAWRVTEYLCNEGVDRKPGIVMPVRIELIPLKLGNLLKELRSASICAGPEQLGRLRYRHRRNEYHECG